MEFNDHVASYHTNVIDITKDGLAHHMLPIDVEIDILHEGLLWVLVDRLELLPNSVLLELHVISIVSAIAKHVAQDFN